MKLKCFPSLKPEDLLLVFCAVMFVVVVYKMGR